MEEAKSNSVEDEALRDSTKLSETKPNFSQTHAEKTEKPKRKLPLPKILVAGIVILITFLAFGLIAYLLMGQNKTEKQNQTTKTGIKSPSPTPDLTITKVKLNNNNFSNLGFTLDIPDEASVYSTNLQDVKGIVIEYPDSDQSLSFYTWSNSKNLKVREWWYGKYGNELLSKQKNVIIPEEYYEGHNGFPFNSDQSFTIKFIQIGDYEFGIIINKGGNDYGLGKIDDQYLIQNGKEIINIVPNNMDQQTTKEILRSFKLTNPNNSQLKITAASDKPKTYTNSDLGFSFSYPGSLTKLNDKLPSTISGGGSTDDMLRISNSDFTEYLHLYLNPSFDYGRNSNCVAIKENNSLKITDATNCKFSSDNQDVGIIINKDVYFALNYKGSENILNIIDSFRFTDQIKIDTPSFF